MNAFSNSTMSKGATIDMIVGVNTLRLYPTVLGGVTGSISFS